jgi:hypothetical protein
MLDLKCFDAIGFKAPDFTEFNRYLDTARLKGHHPSSERGIYAYWPVGSGIEVWAAFDKQLRPLNSNPHFLGTSRVEARVLEMIDVAPTLEGGLRVQVNPRDETVPHYALLFNVPTWDFTRPLLRERKAKTDGPLIVTVQLCAFAEELECFDTPEAFQAVQEEKHRLQESEAALGMDTVVEEILPALHFIPIGLMHGPGEKAQPLASFGGEVMHGHVLHNTFTNQKTLEIGVRTLGMTIDVVADAAVVKGRPRHHGIVCGKFWLSGRIVEEIEATNKRCHLN